MKLVAKAALVLALCTSTLVVADSIDWFNTVAIVDSSGNAVGGTSLWVIQMYQSTDGTINFSNGSPTGDDTILASVFTTVDDGGDGFFFVNFDPLLTGGPVDGARVYSVIFNTTNTAVGGTPTFATEYAVIDNVVSNVADSTLPAFTFNYDTGGTVAGDWQPIVIPEPASMALVGLGIVAAGLRRKMRANA